jgi:hypothetical protein
VSVFKDSEILENSEAMGVYLVVFLSPIQAMFAFILMRSLRVVALYDFRKVIGVTRHSKHGQGLVDCFTLPRSWRDCAKSGGVRFELKDNKLVFDFWLVLVTPHICYQK